MSAEQGTEMDWWKEWLEESDRQDEENAREFALEDQKFREMREPLIEEARRKGFVPLVVVTGEVEGVWVREDYKHLPGTYPERFAIENWGTGDEDYDYDFYLEEYELDFPIISVDELLRAFRALARFEEVVNLRRLQP